MVSDALPRVQYKQELRELPVNAQKWLDMDAPIFDPGNFLKDGYLKTVHFIPYPDFAMKHGSHFIISLLVEFSQS